MRGKYAKRYHAGTKLVLLDPDVRKAFRSEDALRLVIELRKGGSYKRRDYSSNRAWGCVTGLRSPSSIQVARLAQTLEDQG